MKSLMSQTEIINAITKNMTAEEIVTAIIRSNYTSTVGTWSCQDTESDGKVECYLYLPKMDRYDAESQAEQFADAAGIDMLSYWIEEYDLHDFKWRVSICVELPEFIKFND